MTKTLRTTRIYRLGLALIAVHVFDDTILQRPAGGSLISAVAPLLVLALAACAPARLRPGLAVLFGFYGLAGGAEAVYYGGLEHVTGYVSIVVGLGLIGLGARLWWRTRKRALTALATVFVLAFPVFGLCVGYVTTHTARKSKLTVGTAVSVTTKDVVRLDARWTPSRNGAAIIVHGRDPHARLLARHGYGVLLLDRRGQGSSEGQPNIYGWGGDDDVKAGIKWLKARGIERIGGLGLSVGGEVMLDTASQTRELNAVVSEGAGARSLREELQQEMPWHERPLVALQYGARDLATMVSTGHMPPRRLSELVPRIEQPVLLIAAPNSRNGERINRKFGAPVWEIPESKHVGGLEARPAEYERRVIAFFDAAL